MDKFVTAVPARLIHFSDLCYFGISREGRHAPALKQNGNNLVTFKSPPERSWTVGAAAGVPRPVSTLGGIFK